jgi:hypothetical protein
MGGATSPGFDALGAAATLADLVLGQILQPERLARVIDHHRRDPGQPSLDHVLDTLIQRLFVEVSPQTPRQAEIARAAQSVAVDRLLELTRSAQTPRRLQYRLEAAITRLAALLIADPLAVASADDFRVALMQRLDRFAARQEEGSDVGLGAPPAPPGQPIGSGPLDWPAAFDGAWPGEDLAGCAWSGGAASSGESPTNREPIGGGW